MPDSFFATKTRKRKRVASKDSGPSSSRKVLKTSNGRISAKVKGKGKANTHAADGDLHSDESGSEALDDLDLRADEVDPNESGEEDAGETPAEKRLRLAKLYLESVKEGLGASLTPFLTALAFSFCTISGWGGRRGRDRQGADFCSPQAGCT
jgi:ribosomal RNA-processing protein 9